MRFGRKSHRLWGFDYTQSGAYFITLCVQHHECLFGEIHDGEVRLNGFGKIVRECWNDLPNHYPMVELGSFVVMPNHVHAIVILWNNREKPEPPIAVNSVSGIELSNVGAGLKPAPTFVPSMKPFKRHGLSEIVRALKTFSARRINILRGTLGVSVWQRDYHDRIIRRDTSMFRIQRYIAMNPSNWERDRENRIRFD